MGRLQDKVALITGGASGLGAGIAQRFVEEDAKVLITDVNEALGTETAEGLGADFAVQDVVSEAGWRTMLDGIVKKHGRIDTVVNNAGIFITDPVDEMPLENWQKVIDVNLTGVFLGCKHGIAAMKANPGGASGSIINLSSVSGLRGQLGGSAYNASKGGVRLLTKTVALENAALGIRCNSIHPGIIDTPILDPVFEAAEDPAALRAAIESRLPIGKMGEPAHDIGNMAVFLACDESTYVTGSEFVVDGGMTAGLPT